MKVDRTKSKRSSTEVPPDCKVVIERIKACETAVELFTVLSAIENWTYGKCELYHWIDVLDIFDSYLEQAARTVDGSKWAIALDAENNETLRSCVTYILNFTTLLIEHSFSRNLYNSMDHLVKLLNSVCIRMVLEVLQLLFMFSKRSNFLARLPEEYREELLERLTYIADSWGGMDAGYGLAECCTDHPLSFYPASARGIHMEFPYQSSADSRGKADSITVIHRDDVTELGSNPATAMDALVEQYSIPAEKQIMLFTHLRLAFNFPEFSKRCQCVQARLQAMSILVYTNALHDNFPQLLYGGLMDEIVELLRLDSLWLTEIKAAGLRALTSVIHLDRVQNFPSIIDVTGIGSYHGFLPIMVRNCITSMIAPPDSNSTVKPCPISLATALFSFIYHLASYELGGEALVSCGMLESLLKVVTWKPQDEDQITFVTRAVRVIDLITNMDMQGFHTHSGLNIFINRLEIEVADCRKEQPFEIIPEPSTSLGRQNTATSHDQDIAEEIPETVETNNSVTESSSASAESQNIPSEVPMDTDSNAQTEEDPSMPGPVIVATSSLAPLLGNSTHFVASQHVCLPQRAALLKSLLNFLKKVIQDASFSDSIRHIMETTLPNSLRHIISNSEYYGSSLFLLATDVVTVYVFQEPSLLSALQDSGLTDVVQEAILVKEVPATREVIASIPNIFSALCLNNRGLNAFLKCKPFHKICKLLISPHYLAAMRRRRSAEPMGDTATNLGGAMDELMRHQPGLRAEATIAMVQLLEDLCNMSVDARYLWWKDHPPKLEASLTTTRAGTSEVGSSEEDDDDEEPSVSSQPQSVAPPPTGTHRDAIPQPSHPDFGSKPPPPMTDYIFNVMKFLDAILSNNNTDDHCREFVTQQGILPLVTVLSLPYLPLDFPNTASCQAVSAVCKSILSLAHEKKVLTVGMDHLEKALQFVDQLGDPLPDPGSSVLLKELASATGYEDGVIIPGDPSETPILASMTSVHSLIMMFIQVCRTGQPEIRNMSLEQWGTEKGLKLLKRLSKVYLNLVWESTVLLAICSGEYKPGPSDFARRELDILVPPSKFAEVVPESEASAVKEGGSNIDQMEVDAEQVPSTTYVSSATQTTHVNKSDKANTTLQEYARILKPVLSASSRLGRALAELFGLLVKLAIGTPIRQRRGMPIPNGPVIVSPYADSIATVLSDLLAQGLRWEPIATSPVPKLQLSICAVGFSSPLLFDEKRFPYHLMLKKFIDSEGLKALFEVFYWAIGPDSGSKREKSEHDGANLSDQQVEFLDSWLVLVEKFVNPKMVLESPHSLPAKNGILTKRLQFNSNAFLGHVHKLAFKAILYLWKMKPIKLIGHRPADLMLSILCNILRHKEVSESNARKGHPFNAPQVVENQSRGPSPMSSHEGADIPFLSGLDLPDALLDLSDSEATGRIVAPRGEPMDRWENSTNPTATAEAVSSSGPAVNESASVEPTVAVTEASADGSNTAPSDSTSTAAAVATNNQADMSNGNSQAATPVQAPASSSALGNSDALRALGLDPNQLQQLLDMGFPQSLCVEALISTPDLVQATDYLLNNVAGVAPPSTGTSARAMPPLTRVPAPNPSSSARPRQMGDWAMEWDYHDDDIFRAIVMSMGDNETEKGTKVEEKTAYEMLSSEEIEEFTADVFEKALELVEQVPESVFRVCELLVSVGNRKGPEWMTETVKKLAQQTTTLIQAVNARISSCDKEDLHQTADDTMLCIRLHLFSLVFEEVKSTCYETIEYSGIIMLALELLLTLQRLLRMAANRGTVLDVPKWTAPIILLLDLYEKAAIASRRKALLAAETDHVWKWYDINSGKWCAYSTPNNHAIDKAFWDGDSSVRITAGRRRYGISFSGMVQLNEETSNRRPIALWLKQDRKDHPSMLRVLNSIRKTAVKEGSSVPPTKKYVVSYRASCQPPRLKFYHYDKPMEVEEDLSMVHKDMLILNGLSSDSTRLIITACVDFLRLPVEPDSLHAIMRLCLRLTREYELALYFSELGGVSALLSLNSSHHFTGFLPLANLIIRHCMEDPACLRFAIEKMIREKVCTPCAATCKELHYLLRVLAPIACRAPSIFVDVAKEILRVDIPFVTRRGMHVDEDRRLVVKTIPSKPESFRIHSDSNECARDVIQKLLVALVERYDEDDTEECTNKKAEPLPTARCSRPGGPGGGMMHSAAPLQNPRGDLVDPFEQMDLDAPSTSSATAQKAVKNEVNEKSKNNKPLISKCAILQLLAESVHSYTYACKIIAEYSFQGGSCKNVPEDCTALGFLLDRLGPLNQFLGNKDCNTILRDLLAGMAGCNHLPDAQAIVISEVKAALHRLLVQRESQEKHLKIQYLLNLISFMIETCPSSVMTQFLAVKLPHVTTFNHVVRLLIKKNVVTDLARVVHHVDLSSKYLAQTINASLKCLELISRVVNIPTQPAQLKPRPKSGSQNLDSDNNTHTMPTSNSEATRAQGEEIVEDAENTEHDISAAAESLDPISEGHTQDHEDHDNGEHDAFQEIMDQLLDRDNIHAEEALNESQNSLMDTETTEAQRANEGYDGDHHVVDSDSSISSEPSSEGEGDDDEDDEDGHNGGADDDDDDDDDDDEEGDGEDGLSNYDETPDERLLRNPPVERDDEMLMVQYGAGDEAGPIFFTNNTTYNFNLGLFEETLMSDQSNVGLRLNHPLLQPPTSEATVHGAVSRAHRTGRQRRYHYFQYINTRHPPPPPILQRLLGPSTAQDVIQLTTGQTLNHQGVRDTRLLVMDTTNDQNVNRAGATASSGTISNFTALHWWCEEAKVLDGESMHDCIVGVKKEIVEAVEQERDEAFQARKEKKKADDELKKKTQEQSSSAMQTQAATTAEAGETAQAAGAGASLLSSRPASATSLQEIRQRALALEGELASRQSTESGQLGNVGFESLRESRVGLDPSWRQAASSLPTPGIEGFRPTLTDEQIEEDVLHISQNAARAQRPATSAPIVHDDETIDWSGDAQVPGENSVPENTNSIPLSIPEAIPVAAPTGEDELGSSATQDPMRVVIEEETVSPESLRRAFVGALAESGILPDENEGDSGRDELRITDDTSPSDEATPSHRHAQILVRDEPVAGPSGIQSQRNEFAEILGDIEIPDGVDPSFLAALPEDMRQEVIAEHLRVQRLSEPNSQPILEAPATTALDVSPEFLAALPPNIQEEVLAQQRLEQQRRVATAANPNDPVDAEAFFRTLQPNLRQLILADMEESQMAVIPPEFAEEAQNLRRNWVTRNRQILQERLFHSHHSATSALSSILRHSGMRLTGRFGLHGGVHRSQWPSGWISRPPTLMHPNNIVNTKAKGKQLVDFETLSCLMVILFLDDSKINTGRLHRVIRNLCYHTQTRAWMIRSLLSIVEKSDDTFTNTSSQPIIHTLRGRVQAKELVKKSGTVTELPPTWLNISLDSALGCSGSNVFQIHKVVGGTTKKLGSDQRFITIHPQAVTQIARHAIDALSNLAKSFPAQFLPYTAAEQEVKILNTDMSLTPTPETSKRTMQSTSPGRSKQADSGDLLFWDFLLKLDGAASGKKGKSLAKMGLNAAPAADAPQGTVAFEASAFGRLIKMLGYQFIRHKQIMMDKILRLLSLISLGVPENTGYGKKVYLDEPQPPLDESRLISETHLRLIIEVITSKYCSEEGLEDATSLLLNLSYGPTRIRHKVTALLTEGVQELGKVVCSNIKELMAELKTIQVDPEKEDEATTSSEVDGSEKVFKGMITDRFTKDTVVITSATKSKTAYELQLPSMSGLTSKTSSQAFFLRLLKLVMSLRGLTRGAIRRHKREANAGSTSQPIIQPSANESPHTQRRRENLNRFMARHLGIVGGSGSSRAGNSSSVDDMFMDVVLPETHVVPAAAPTPVQDTSQQPAAQASASTPPVPGTSSNMQGSKEDGSTELNIKNETVIDEDYLLPRLSVELQLDELWETLSECLLSLGHMPDHHAVLVLQPAVEAFFLVHTLVTDDHYKRFLQPTREAQLAPVDEEHGATPDPSVADMPDDAEMVDQQNCTGVESTNVATDLPPDTQKFLSFAETHRTVLNHILRQSTVHLADGPFAVLVDHTRVLDFDIKRRYFRSELERLDDGVRREDLAVHVRRQHVFEDSFRELHRKSAEEWKNRFYIVFEGEEGQDAGGLLREWYVIISREIFNPMYALFTISPGDRVTYMINSSSHCNSNHLFYFKFVGRVIAKAIYDNKLLECYFTRSFYKHILGKYVQHQDMESEDYAFFQGLAFLMDNHISELGYDVTFSTEVQEFGVTEVRDLIPNGRNIPVTEENKMEYVRLVCRMKMTGAIRKQLNAFLEGFYDIIPKRLISIFNEQELELLVSGLPNVDIEDLKANTEYHKYHATSLQIQWFWRALRSFDQADRAKFLQFVTGTSKVPLQGFGSLEGMNGVQKFQIHRDDRSTDRLPSAHTCFNQLDLPAYETYDKLRTYMLKAIHECSEGFGFA